MLLWRVRIGIGRAGAVGEVMGVFEDILGAELLRLWLSRDVHSILPVLRSKWA